MLVYRIARAAYSALDGEGARRSGGRWNSPGTPVVYTAGSRALAVLEVLAWTNPATAPLDLALFEIEAPAPGTDDVVSPESLPAGWRQPGFAGCRAAGDAWAASASSTTLRVPSAIVPEEWNYLINPRHPGFATVRIVSAQPFEFDSRLLR